MKTVKQEIIDCNGDCGCAAIEWANFGYTPVPIVPGTKRPAVKRDPWLNGLSLSKIERHWEENPAHEVAAILDDTYIVLDADTATGNTAIQKLMKDKRVKPALIISTKRGYHYHFRLAAGVVCRTRSHNTMEHPERIDIRAGGSMAMLPPSTNKRLIRCDAQSIEELTEVGQDFVDALYRHNKTDPPREIERVENQNSDDHSDLSIGQLVQLLESLDPDESYDDWTRVGMALHSATVGSQEGLDLFDEWSNSGEKYAGHNEIDYKWRSYARGSGRPITAGTLIYLAREAGADVSKILKRDELEFEVISDVEHKEKPPDDPGGYRTPFHQYSLSGCSDELKRNQVDAVYVLLGIALLAQFTVIFGVPNVGKTMLLLWLLREAIEAGRIDPDGVFYINEDDDVSGLISKNELAEELGIHMLSSGYRDFERGDTLRLIQEMVTDGNCAGAVIVLDTVKKFVDVMDKRSSSTFSTNLRQFVKKGGTVIVLAHTNKRPDKGGKGIPGGTSDLLDDADAGYVLNVVENDVAGKRKVVDFTEVKLRGGEDHSKVFQYSTAKGISYRQRLDSVERLTDERQEAMEQDRIVQLDQPAIAAITELILSGSNSKMEIVKQGAVAAGVSQGVIKEVIDRYIGKLWQFNTEARGKQVFELMGEL